LDSATARSRTSDDHGGFILSIRVNATAVTGATAQEATCSHYRRSASVRAGRPSPSLSGTHRHLLAISHFSMAAKCAQKVCLRVESRPGCTEFRCRRTEKHRARSENGRRLRCPTSLFSSREEAFWYRYALVLSGGLDFGACNSLFLRPVTSDGGRKECGRLLAWPATCRRAKVVLDKFVERREAMRRCL
jgi:hypothetical protein